MIIRQAPTPEGDYFMMRNSWARDERLSRRARGLLAELLSHRDGWTTSVEVLVSRGTDGRDAIYATLAELRNHGYLVLSQERGPGGLMSETTYTLCDPGQPLPAQPDAVQPDAVGPDTAEPHAYKKTSPKKTTPEKTTRTIEPPHSRAATVTRQQLWYLEAMAAEDLDSLEGIDLGGLSKFEAAELIRAAKREGYQVGGNPEHLGDGLPEMQAQLARTRPG